MIRTILLLDQDVDVLSAALPSLRSPSCRVLAASGEDDPQALARRYPADLLVLGSVGMADGDMVSSLRTAFRNPVVPLFRPSVYVRRQARPADLGPDFMLGLLDCRQRIEQHRRSRVLSPEVAIDWGGFTLKLVPSAFAFRGSNLDLTRVQAAILTFLIVHSGEVVSCSMIEDAVFHGKPLSRTNFISVHISRLRARLRDARSDVCIENVKGIGYALFWNRSFSADMNPEPEVLSNGVSRQDAPSIGDDCLTPASHPRRTSNGLRLPLLHRTS